MFVMTAKLSKPRLIAAGVLILAVVILVVALVSGGGGGSADAPDGATNDARLAYLAGFGWSVNGTPKPDAAGPHSQVGRRPRLLALQRAAEKSGLRSHGARGQGGHALCL